jgi:hypothetical protein
VVRVILAPGVFLSFTWTTTPPAATPPGGTFAFLTAWGLPALVLTLVVAALALATRLLGLPWREEE